MNKTIIAVAVIVALAYVWTERYQITNTGEGLAIWKHDTWTGKTTFCHPSPGCDEK